MRLLLLSNSTNFGGQYLEHALAAIESLLAGRRRLLFIPFALHDTAAYTRKVAERFASLGVSIDALRPEPAGAEALVAAEAVFVGGGNTFRLVDRLHRSGLMAPLRRRALEGMPYLGASAGTNIAAPTLRTTNDMPIVEPPSFRTLGLVPFQVNPHYFDADPASRHMGETREDRLREFLEENDAPVVGLREGSWLSVEGEQVRLEGAAGARVFRRGREPVEVAHGQLLDLRPGG